ncbi:MAG: hypothetical protein IPG63_01485 [Xanthomonadales bacterium]|nr:hypothetical protein [Xanthomonadales bacterium]MCC6560924.1 hypothetical protein [Xanthomonadales bacterium]
MDTRTVFCAAASILVLVAPTTATAGNGRWTSNGPDGGMVYEVRFDPNVAGLMYATTGGGFFRSDDGGLTWSRSNDGIIDVTNTPLIVDAEAPGHLYVFDFGNRLYHSDDYGLSWTPTGFVVPSGQYPWMATDEPGSVGRFYVTLGAASSGAPASPLLLRTSDGGASFAVPGTGLPNLAFFDIEFEPGNASHLIASVEWNSVATSGLYRSIDGGATWNPAGPAASYALGISFGAGSGATRRVYASIDGFLNRSDDNGATWAETNPGSPFSTEQVLAHPTLADTVYFSDDAIGNLLVDGLQRSTDAGVSATRLTTGLSSNPSYTDLLNPTKALPVDPFQITASPDFPAAGSTMWLTTEGDGLFRSIDGGNSWQPSQVDLRASKVRALAIHPNPSNIDPGTGAGKTVLAGYSDVYFSSPAMYRSTNAGNSWNVLNQGLRAAQIRAIAFDPTTAGVGSAPPYPPVNSAVVYAAGRASATDLGSSGAHFGNGGLYKSSTGGLTWSVIDGGLPRLGTPPNDYAAIGLVRALAIDLRSCSSPPPSGPCVAGPLQTLYASADGLITSTVIDTTSVPGTRQTIRSYSYRLIKTSDAGATWQAIDNTANGFPAKRRITACPDPDNNGTCDGPNVSYRQEITPLPIVVHPVEATRLYVGTYVGSNSVMTGSPTPDPVTGVFVSVDGGSSWMAENYGLPLALGKTNQVQDILAMAMHPTDGQVLWAATRDYAVPGSGSIYKTVDGGAHWFESGNGLRGQADIRALAVDPSDPTGNTLYASGAGTPANPGSVYRSDDGGASWRSISIGLPADSALAIAVDPFNYNLLHAGTNTGIWSLTQVPDDDGDGIPDATENNAPSGGDGNGDGFMDSAQRDVGSSVIIIRQPEGSGGFFTSDVIGADSTPSVPGGCQQATDVQAQPSSLYGRDLIANGTHYHRYPRDLVRFEVLDCTHAVVDVTFHGAAFDVEYGWSFRMFGPLVPGDDDSLRWRDFASRAARVPGSGNKWRITLDANQFGSYRPMTDRILFVGGPACYDDRLFRDGMESAPDTGPPSCDH